MPISSGNASLEFGTNGQSYTLPYVNVSSWDQKPVYAEDGYTLIRYETTINGTSVLSDGLSTYTLIADRVKQVPGKVDFATITVNGSTLFTVTAPDALNGPLMSMTINEVAGRRAAIINFTLTPSTTNV